MNRTTRFGLMAGCLATTLPWSVVHAQNVQAQQSQAFQAEQNRQGWMQSQQSTAYQSQAESQAREAAYRAQQQHREDVRIDKARDWWAVILVDTTDGSWATQFNETSSDRALLGAMDRCKGICWPLVTFANTCMAPSYSARGGMFWAEGENKRAAQSAAADRCNAAGQGECRAPKDQAVCSGYRYYYAFNDRVGNWRGSIKPKQVTFGPGAEAYVAKPPQERGRSTAVSAGTVTSRDNEDMLGKFADAWTAIAAEQNVKEKGKGLGLELAPSREAAASAAMATCGSSRCRVLLTAKHGSCISLVVGASPAGGTVFFTAETKDKDAAEGQAKFKCKQAGVGECSTIMARCL